MENMYKFLKNFAKNLKINQKLYCEETFMQKSFYI